MSGSASALAATSCYGFGAVRKEPCNVRSGASASPPVIHTLAARVPDWGIFRRHESGVPAADRHLWAGMGAGGRRAAVLGVHGGCGVPGNPLQPEGYGDRRDPRLLEGCPRPPG